MKLTVLAYLDHGPWLGGRNHCLKRETLDEVLETGVLQEWAQEYSHEINFDLGSEDVSARLITEEDAIEAMENWLEQCRYDNLGNYAQGLFILASCTWVVFDSSPKSKANVKFSVMRLLNVSTQVKHKGFFSLLKGLSSVTRKWTLNSLILDEICVRFSIAFDCELSSF